MSFTHLGLSDKVLAAVAATGYTTPTPIQDQAIPLVLARRDVLGIARICKLVPFTRQTLFFTATMPPEISRITETFLHNPARIEVSKPATTAVGVSQFQVSVGREPHEKRDILRRLLRDAKDLQNAIIFCNRKREVALLYKSLQKHGFSVGALHGDMDQSARTAALDQFRKGEIPLLVASDVAARGLAY